MVTVRGVCKNGLSKSSTKSSLGVIANAVGDARAGTLDSKASCQRARSSTLDFSCTLLETALDMFIHVGIFWMLIMYMAAFADYPPVLPAIPAVFLQLMLFLPSHILFMVPGFDRTPSPADDASPICLHIPRIAPSA